MRFETGVDTDKPTLGRPAPTSRQPRTKIGAGQPHQVGQAIGLRRAYPLAEPGQPVVPPPLVVSASWTLIDFLRQALVHKALQRAVQRRWTHPHHSTGGFLDCL